MKALNQCPLCGGSSGYTVSGGSTHRWVLLDCQNCGQPVAEARAAELVGVYQPSYHKAWNEAGQHAQALRNGNFALLEALMDMCLQYLTRPNGDHIWHDYMSAGENAMSVLTEAGLIYVVDGKYTLNWESLERRRNAL